MATGAPPSEGTAPLPGDGLDTPHDGWAQWYDAVYEATYGDSYRWLTDETLKAVLAVARPGSAILDVGAGTGRLAIPLARSGFAVHAIDRSPAMLHQLLRRAAVHGVGDRVTAQCVDVVALRHPPGFDVALCVFTVLLYLPDLGALARTFEGIASALRPGGRLLVDVPKRSLFEGYEANTEAIHRRVRISPVAGDPERRRFAYEDDAYLKAPHHVRIADRFIATWWSEPEVIAAATRAGLALEADVSDRFERAASAHWWMRKPVAD